MRLLGSSTGGCRLTIGPDNRMLPLSCICSCVIGWLRRCAVRLRECLQHRRSLAVNTGITPQKGAGRGKCVLSSNRSLVLKRQVEVASDACAGDNPGDEPTSKVIFAMIFSGPAMIGCE